MTKTALVAVVFITVLTGGSIALIELASRSDSGRPVRALPDAPPEPEHGPVTAPDPRPEITVAPLPALLEKPPLREFRPPPAAADTWAVLGMEPPANTAGTLARASETWVSIPLRPRDLRTLWLAISEAAPDLSQCWAREGRAEVTTRGGRMSVGGGKPAALQLQLESTGEAVRIVGAPVDATGDDRSSTVRCAQAQLVGLTIPLPRTLDGSPLAEAGTRTQMRFMLQ